MSHAVRDTRLWPASCRYKFAYWSKWSGLVAPVRLTKSWVRAQGPSAAAARNGASASNASVASRASRGPRPGALAGGLR
jgi:hypothetical protein